MNLTKNQIFIIFGIALVVIVLVLIVAGVIPGLKEPPQVTRNADLTIWGFDSKKAIDPAIATFAGNYKGVKISYREFADEAGYEAALLDALAAGQGPDIFAVRNSGLAKNVNKIAPLARESLTTVQLHQFFPQVVERDLVPQGVVSALPASMDTLALIYNKDLMNQAGIITPPGTWTEFVKLVPKLTKTDASRRVVQAGAALGGSAANIPRAADILSLLMLQNGVPMVSDDFSSAQFSTPEGAAALTFYTQFTNTGSAVYTWNNGLGNAMDLFAQGKVAMLFDYSSALTTLRARNPLLNIDVAPVPQQASATTPVTYARYFGYTVSRQSQNADLAWQFILTLTTNPDVTSKYLIESGSIPAFLPLLGSYFNDPKLNVFARQVLIARSWPQYDPLAVERIFSDMISLVSENRTSVDTALRQGEAQVSALMAR